MSLQPNWDRWRTAIGTAFRGGEDALGDLVAVAGGLFLQYAEGQQLNQWGELVQFARKGLTDEQYRGAIRVKIATLFTSGTIPEILQIVVGLLPGREPVLTETPPAAFKLTYTQLTADEQALLCRILKDVPSAGVRALLETFDPGLNDGFGYTTAPIPDLGHFGYTSGTSIALGDFSPYGYAVPIDDGDC